ncbi:MAG: hypothetical protein IJT94_12730 [Oscillibacter sp.]|nr:hypothetical protein [Oscillibacter sp.]
MKAAGTMADTPSVLPVRVRARLSQERIFLVRLHGYVSGWTVNPAVMRQVLEMLEQDGYQVESTAEVYATTYWLTKPGEKSAPPDGANIGQGNGFGPESQ